MKQAVIELLSCPVCGAGMACVENGRVCRCLGNRPHSFDFAKSGHIHLGGPRAGDGDTKEAVLARRMFLDAGFYEPLSNEVNEMLSRIGAERILDAGCGEGYYTNRMASAQESRAVLGIDLSRAGIDYAARRAKQMETGAGFAVASIFALPVKNESMDAVTSIFAPCAEQAFSDVLRPQGSLILVGAGERHLMGLKQILYENPYVNEKRADLPQNMQEIDRKKLSYTITVTGKAQIEALFSMTPYYWRTSRTDHAKLAQLDSLTTEVDFDIFLFRKGS